ICPAPPILRRDVHFIRAARLLKIAAKWKCRLLEKSKRNTHQPVTLRRRCLRPSPSASTDNIVWARSTARIEQSWFQISDTTVGALPARSKYAVINDFMINAENAFPGSYFRFL